jgi:hypothetical protein
MMPAISSRRWRSPSSLAVVLFAAAFAAAVVGAVIGSTVCAFVEAGMLDGTPSVREQPTTITVDATANVALVPAAYTTPTSGRCVVPDTTNVFVVTETATTTTGGDGPYCTTCTAGALIPIAGRAWARTSSGSTVLSCRFVDDGNGFGGGGGGGAGVLSTAVCLLVGGASCTMVGDVIFSGSAAVQPTDNSFEVKDSNGNVDITISTSTSSQPASISGPGGTGQAKIGFNDNTVQVGTNTTTVTTAVFSAGTLPGSTAMAEGFQVYAGKAGRWVPGTALVTATPTDTTSTPLGSGSTGAGTACRMSSTGVSAWTPSETGAVDGEFFCCTNTGANVITMTASAGVYEGTAAVGQWDVVCMEYVTDRWVQQSFQNN